MSSKTRMLEAFAEFAGQRPRWQQNILMKGFREGWEEGQLIGTRKALQIILASRFGELPRELLAVMDKISNIKTLYDLQREAVLAASLAQFMEKFPDSQDTGSSL